MIQEELSGEIIGAGMDVLNELRPGLDEKLYERAIIIELKRRGHTLSIQRAFPVFYRGELIGNLIPDLIVDHTLIFMAEPYPCYPWFFSDFQDCLVYSRQKNRLERVALS